MNDNEIIQAARQNYEGGTIVASLIHRYRLEAESYMAQLNEMTNAYQAVVSTVNALQMEINKLNKIIERLIRGNMLHEKSEPCLEFGIYSIKLPQEEREEWVKVNDMVNSFRKRIDE